jgi:branched-chain amino acid transport system substrate-binding protein
VNYHEALLDAAKQIARGECRMVVRLMQILCALVAFAGPVLAQDRPSELTLPIFTFTSGPAAAYGVPGRNAAELMIEQINAKGGIGGVKVRAIFVDEAQGGAGVVSEFRRLAGDQNVQLMIAALSSANCLSLAPVAEELKTPMLAWNCDTHQLFLKDRYKFVYRSNSSTIPEFLAYVLYLVARKPDFRRVAIINPDYAFGRDAAEIVKGALKSFKPDAEIVTELFPKLGTPNFQTEISRLVAARPDVIFSNLWGADLENFVRQALPRGLFTQTQMVLALGENLLQRIEIPDGVIIGVLGDGWWQTPTARADDRTQSFVRMYRERYGEYPIFPVFKMANSILTMQTAYENVLKESNRWPSREQLANAFARIKVKTYTGMMTIREDNDGLVDQVVGVSQKSGAPYPIMGDMVRYPADKVTPPPWTDPHKWIGGLTGQWLAGLPKPGSYK